MPLWWDRMPQGIRNNIAFKIDFWATEHGHHPASSIVLRRRLDMLLNRLREPAAGFTRLFPAARADFPDSYEPSAAQRFFHRAAIVRPGEGGKLES